MVAALRAQQTQISIMRLVVLNLSPCGQGRLIPTAGDPLSLSSLLEIQGWERRRTSHP